MAKPIHYGRRRFLGTAAATIAGVNLTAAVRLPIEGDMPSLGRATEWLQSPPLSTAGLRGKVVLVNFWTYSCINWLRSLPYVRAWNEKYQRQGFVVIGVHAPEFALRRTSITFAGP